MARKRRVTEEEDNYILANYTKMTKKKIAAALGIPEGTVVSRYQCLTYGKRRWKDGVVLSQERPPPSMPKLRFLGEKE